MAAGARFVATVVVVMGLAVMAGCGRGVEAGGGKAVYAREGVTFQLPPGWVMGDNLHYQLGHSDDRLGVVMVNPLGVQTLDAYVTTAARQLGNVVGSRSFQVNGNQAVELLIQSESSVYEAYIQRGNDVVYLSFTTPPDAFDQQLPAFRAAAESVRFQ